jgi:hypothetical protein
MNLQGRDLKQDMRGDDVALLQRELMLIGHEVPIDERQASVFGPGTLQVVTRFQKERGMQTTGVVDAQTARAINAVVDAETISVEGMVSSRTRAGVARLQIQIVDKNVGEDVVLMNAFTDDDGHYETAFSIAALRQRGKQQPDLQARAFSPRTHVLLGASEVRYNASKRETLNILVEGKANEALASEHATLVDKLSTHFRGNLGDLQETDDRQDITYLANKTGWDARLVALAALANQFSARTADPVGAPGIAPPFFYALFRAGLSANEDALYRIDANTAASIWKRSIEQGVIPAALTDSIPEATKRFQGLVSRRALEVPALPGISSLKEMLSASLVDDAEKQRQFADLYTRHRDDPPKLWDAVRSAFGEAAEKRLRLDGQLAYLTLNNASLIRKLHDSVGQDGLSDTVNLVEEGFYHADKWQSVIGNDPIPADIPGATAEEQRAHYAELLSAQVRLSFPTAVMAQMVKSGDTPLSNASVREEVHAFLTEHHAKFEIGMQPVERFIAKANLQIAPEVAQEVKRIQRVYQITPSDTAMNALLKKDVDSAYQVVRYGQDEFVQIFQEDLGGEAQARLAYAKAQQVHNAVLNIATSYLIANTAPGIGSHSQAQIVNPAPRGVDPQAAGDVIAYPTLEGLFDAMDYCECEHCRSILSPAAYLVNLLQFCDSATVTEKENPQSVLFERRPDIQHLPLTCENTNTPLPYIDLVNETLEYFGANNLTLDNYAGHSIDGDASTEELLASPQFVSEAAYATLKEEMFPPPLPFHQPLENLRRYFYRFDARLSQVMEALRKDESMERASADEYGWRDILMEELRLSRTEHKILTNYDPPLNTKLTLQQLYGYAPATLEADVLADLANAKAFTERVGITYEDIIEILKTRFINPDSTLIPKLERLGVPFSTLKTLKESPLTGQAWLDLLPKPLPDPSQYGSNIEAWVKNEANFGRIMGLITLSNPTAAEDLCQFDKLELRYANPDNNANKLRAFEFIRFIRFIRLWKKLGWTIEQTDKAIIALYPADEIPDDSDDTVNLQRLDAGFLTLLPRLGVIKRVRQALKLKLNQDLLPLLACFAPIDAHGAVSLYRQMFLSPALLKLDAAFADDGFGNFLTDSNEKLARHAEALRAAFQITDAELSEIGTALGFNANTPLTLDNISAVFRHGWLARKLRLSVREFLLLIRLTGLDPFAAPDAPNPPILRFIEFVYRIRAAALKPVQALYLIWNQDISGKSSPEEREITDFARTLRASFAAIESEFAIADDPDGAIARARMALVYGNEAADLFFGLLGNTLVTEVTYSHGQNTLEQAILDAAPARIAYDDFRKRLFFSGVMTTDLQNALKTVTDVSAAFKTAVDSLYTENQKVAGPFFDRYPELLPLHDAFVFFGDLKSTVGYVHSQQNLEQAIVDVAPGRITYDHASSKLSFKGVMSATTRDALKTVAGVTPQFQAAVETLFADNQAAIQGFFADHPTPVSQQVAYLEANDSLEQRRSVLLEGFLPELKRRRKRQQALQAISAAAKTDVGFASALLDDSDVLHAIADDTRHALDDLTAVETAGLSAQFFFRDTASGNVDRASDAESNLAYSATGSNKLPANPTPGAAISGIWAGYLEAPENGFFNFGIEAESSSVVTLTVDSRPIDLAQNGTVWSNSAALELRAGTLYAISLKVEKVKDTLSVHWQRAGRGREIIPSRNLYSAALLDHLHTAYLRFLRAASLADSLRMTAAETVHFASHPDYRIGGQGWLNSLPAIGNPDTSTATALFTAFDALLGFARIKAALSPDDERLLSILKDPVAAAESPDGVLFVLTRWTVDSLNALLTRFGRVIADLFHFDAFSRIYEAFAPVKAMGIPASALIKAATNKPNAITVHDLQAALRARYEEADWLNVLKPINDEMRGLQRDALVAYILHGMRQKDETKHIDTPDKLFEYFLMDVQMEPCMQTSRIRHALSSVQLFIERCLMNLELQVAPSSINTKQWEWMKRYRIWEANRKVFLWPENWLEPELRDDQSPFFKETMSELLQSDITEDRAAIALLNYLSKLEEVAKLEPCGIHYLENDTGAGDDIAHVVARTAGANRKYFYRRREYGYWTPWEQIRLDIEDNPVIPVVWQGRLLLFWLRILKQAPLSNPTVRDHRDERKLTEVTPSDLVPTGTPKVIVQAVLCWSEYYNSKWQPTKTSDVNNPTVLGEIDPTAFDRSALQLSVAEEGDALRVIIRGLGSSSFLLFNTHSLPVPQTGPFALPAAPQRTMDASSDSFTILYSNGLLLFNPNGGFSGVLTRPVLKNELDDRAIQPNHLLQSPWGAPFFYEDGRHVFFVTTSERIVQIRQWDWYGIVPDLVKPPLAIPSLVFKPDEVRPDRLGPIVTVPNVGVVDRTPIERFISEDAYIDRAIGTSGTVPYGNNEIGPAGVVLQRR